MSESCLESLGSARRRKSLFRIARRWLGCLSQTWGRTKTAVDPVCVWGGVCLHLLWPSHFLQEPSKDQPHTAALAAAALRSGPTLSHSVASDWLLPACLRLPHLFSGFPPSWCSLAAETRPAAGPEPSPTQRLQRGPPVSGALLKEVRSALNSPLAWRAPTSPGEQLCDGFCPASSVRFPHGLSLPMIPPGHTFPRVPQHCSPPALLGMTPKERWNNNKEYLIPLGFFHLLFCFPKQSRKE